MKTAYNLRIIPAHKLQWLIAIVFLLSTVSCSKKSASTAQLQIRMTDNPAVNVKEVWIDVQGIEVISNNAAPVILPGAHPGLYNLMDLTNGKDTLLADATLPAGDLSQIRLILGDNNYVVSSDGAKLPLKTPSAQESGLKIQVHQSLTGGILYRLVLDFDAARSIVTAGNSGQILLKPVIRILSLQPSGGNIAGVVLPANIPAIVYAIKGPDTISTTFSSIPSGNFLLKDVPAGDYELSFVSTDPSYFPVQKMASVSLGKTTLIDTVRLQH